MKEGGREVNEINNFEGQNGVVIIFVHWNRRGRFSSLENL